MTRGQWALAAGTLAIIGGILMVLSGYETQGLLLTALEFAETKIPQFVGGIPGLTVELAVAIVAFIIALGGFTVVLGGLAILARHRTLGRFLVLLGGGAGFLGLGIAIGYSLVRLGPSAVTAHVPYWLGLVLAVMARRAARNA